MRPRIQAKLVTEHMRYLEEQIGVMEPVMKAMKSAMKKSKTWLEDTQDDRSLTYLELQQVLDTATQDFLDLSSALIHQSNDVQDDTERVHSVTYTASTVNLASRQSLIELPTDIVNRIDLIEKTVSLLQDTKQRTEEDILEIKQWKDAVVTEQNDMEKNIEKLSKQHKQKFKNIRKKINEQDDKCCDMNEEIEKLKQKQSALISSIDKLSPVVKKYENDIEKINEEIQDQKNKIVNATQGVNKQSDLISALQEDGQKELISTRQKLDDLFSKQNIICKLLQQRQMSMDRVFQKFTGKFSTSGHKNMKIDAMENDVLRLTTDFHKIENLVRHIYVCQIQLAYTTPVSTDSIILKFGDVREYNGQHFNQTTGKFLSPHDGLYLVFVTLNEWGKKFVQVGVYTEDILCLSTEVKFANTNAAGSVVIDMKKGQELFFKVDHADQNASLSWYSAFSIVSL
ncbi:uncharacterized protein LOC131946135 isoform X2 [Physella acuta]|uniref:uncharacterized protein LOC131946135 isoform X2 n=1 Tax=Physella acuta TaxID=109671 RepID=UPI0027DB0964|nr:uncharacterized protein LOC131946135 isoform X2 [Physella acuta]